MTRCAVYTRKSTDEGLDREFNSLDAQREAGEAYVKSQAGSGWELLPDRYDDGGFSGGNADRPALTRLLADIDAGKVDAVIVYKVDRLSRSLLDFARMMAAFEAKSVAFVSVTQQFNTGTSMGRLVLNVLLSFAQFEREIIAERTRDKIAATRRKGKWSGGHPVLGYDVDAKTRKLVANPEEAEQVRAIFALYLDRGSLLPVVRELAARGWTTKSWTTRDGTARGGGPFTRTNLHQMLTNVLYAGQVRYKAEVHRGEHEAIVDAETWAAVQRRLARAGRSGGVGESSRALLAGILRCGPCGCAMTPTHTEKGAKQYRYYACLRGQKRGKDSCPSKTVSAGAVEAVVVEQIRRIGRDPALVADVLAEVAEQGAAGRRALEDQMKRLAGERTAADRQVRQLAKQLDPNRPDPQRVTQLAEAQERLASLDRQVQDLRQQLAEHRQDAVPEPEIAAALSQFDDLWRSLSPSEQRRVLRLLLEEAEYDAAAGTLSLKFRPAGLETLAREFAPEEATA